MKLRDICIRTIASCPRECKPLNECNRFKSSQDLFDKMLKSRQATQLEIERAEQAGINIVKTKLEAVK